MTAQGNGGRAGTQPFPGLLAGLRLALGTGDREADMATLGGIADWNAVAVLAERHRIGSLLSRGTRTVPTAAPQAEMVLAPSRQRTNIRGLWQLAGLRQASNRLAEAGIPSLVLKGLPLSARLFGTPLARQCFDIDLLVPPYAVAAAGQALSQGGWQLRKPSFSPTPARNRCYDRFVKDRLFVGPGGALELHHRLVNNPFLLQASFESLHTNAANVEMGGHRAAVLGDDDLLVYLAVHGQLHRWSRLRWLCDFAALLAAIDTDRFEAALERCRRQKLALEPTFGAALQLCRESLHVELPTAAASLTLGTRAERAVCTTRRIWNRPRGGRGLQGIARRVDELRTSLAIRPCWQSVAHEVARLCVAPYDLGRVNLPDRLFFLYVPLRPALWLASRLRRDRKVSARPTDTESARDGPSQCAGPYAG